jgi:hypothetical protein
MVLALPPLRDRVLLRGGKVMPSAAAAPRSSLEAMLETIRKRDVHAEDAVPFLPPLPARPRCRVRPPTSTRRRRSLPPGFKLGNGGAGTVPVDEKAVVATEGATIVSAGGAAAEVVHPTVKMQNSAPACMRAEGGGDSSGIEVEPRGRWWRCF